MKPENLPANFLSTIQEVLYIAVWFTLTEISVNGKVSTLLTETKTETKNMKNGNETEKFEKIWHRNW